MKEGRMSTSVRARTGPAPKLKESNYGYAGDPNSFVPGGGTYEAPKATGVPV